MFALRHKITKKIARIEVLGSGDDVEYHLTFSVHEGKICVFTEWSDADFAASNSGTIYSSSFDMPINAYIDELEVVELIVNGE